MSDVSSVTRGALTAAAVALLAALFTLAGSPAFAAPVTVSGLTYELIDEQDPSAGATVTAYDGTGSNHPTVSVFEQIEIDGEWVTVVRIEDEVFRGTGVGHVSVPATVTQLGANVFGDNPDLNSVFFLGAAPSLGQANPIATDGQTDPEIRFLVEHLGTYGAPTWQGFDTVPMALANWTDPHLGVTMPISGLYVRLEQGDPTAPYGEIPANYDVAFEPEVPEGYELAGWLANGEPWTMGSPITEPTVFTPLWLDTTAVMSVVVTPSAWEVEEGDQITLTAEGFNALGESVGDVTADMEFASDVSTDVVDGATITFPTASPHTISGLYLPREIRAEPVVIEVTAAPAPETPAAPEEVADDGPAVPAGSTDELADTGWEEHAGLLSTAGALAALGAALVATRRRLGARA